MAWADHFVDCTCLEMMGKIQTAMRGLDKAQSDTEGDDSVRVGLQTVETFLDTGELTLADIREAELYGFEATVSRKAQGGGDTAVPSLTVRGWDERVMDRVRQILYGDDSQQGSTSRLRLEVARCR